MLASGKHWTSNSQNSVEIRGTSGLVQAPMDSIRSVARASRTTLGPCLYGCTTSLHVVHEEKVHTNEYDNSRAETTWYRHQSVSRAVERGGSHVMGIWSQYLRRRRTRLFHYERRVGHYGARLSRLRVYLGAGYPRILRMR